MALASPIKSRVFPRSSIGLGKTQRRFCVQIDPKRSNLREFGVFEVAPIKTGEAKQRSAVQGISGNGETERRRRRRWFGVISCRAEGIERGLVRGRDEGLGLPERLKVVGLMAFAMCLCNADRVVMSVAVVPLAAKHGWSSSFLGIVQSCCAIRHVALMFWVPGLLDFCAAVCSIQRTEKELVSVCLWRYPSFWYSIMRICRCHCDWLTFNPPPFPTVVLRCMNYRSVPEYAGEMK
ncbi:hypothetical protein ACLOJK_012485 [Asimina triloba]